MKPKLQRSDEDYHYEATCPEHNKQSTDFIGQTDHGYVFRCKEPLGGIAKGFEEAFQLRQQYHTFLAKAVTCFRATAIRGKGSLKTEVWTWTEGNPKPTADVNWKVVNL